LPVCHTFMSECRVHFYTFHFLTQKYRKPTVSDFLSFSQFFLPKNTVLGVNLPFFVIYTQETAKKFVQYFLLKKTST